MPDKLITSEREILRSYINRGADLPTEVRHLPGLNAVHRNPVEEVDVGTYREPNRRKAATADLEVLEELSQSQRRIPAFLEAGPRRHLAFAEADRQSGVKAAVVTTGGPAPGLNSVIHSIVDRHLNTYHKLTGGQGGVWGIYNSFKGLYGERPVWEKLDLERTEEWQEQGGSQLGSIRFFTNECLEEFAARIATNLDRWPIDILYIIGGDGSLTVAHEIAKRTKNVVVVGIPKTMDNDIQWVWQSFGFNTAVAEATATINKIHRDAETTRRVHIVELFGARTGFVAANAALASGHVDLVIVPEVFNSISATDAEAILEEYVAYLERTLRRKLLNPHELIVLAEGAGAALADIGASLGGTLIEKERFSVQLTEYLSGRLRDLEGNPMRIVLQEPSYEVRSVPANAQDQIYCKRLGALAVDNAFAGYTDFMISQWLTEYVLVPLELVASGKKAIPPGGIFWKQVVSSTGQPPTPHPGAPEDTGREERRDTSREGETTSP